jgi:3'-phosphoadenosine 5'-phosphosulfate sulfotransferase
VAAELGDPTGALEAATQVNVDALPAGLHSRRAQVRLDLAWAQAQRRRDAEAVLMLLEAERVAPETPRYNVIAREMIREMVNRAKRGHSSALHSLAARAGVLE